MYAIQKTLFLCSISLGLRLKPDPRLCSPILCDNRMAAATKKKEGCGLGVPCKNKAYRCRVRHNLEKEMSSELTIPSRACTLSRSVFRIVSSVWTAKAFFR